MDHHEYAGSLRPDENISLPAQSLFTILQNLLPHVSETSATQEIIVVSAMLNGPLGMNSLTVLGQNWLLGAIVELEEVNRKINSTENNEWFLDDYGLKVLQEIAEKILSANFL